MNGPDIHAPDSGAPAVRAVEQPFWGYQDAVMFFAAAPVMLFAGSLIAHVAFAFFRLRGQGRAAEQLAAQLIAYVLWFAFLCLLLRIKYGRPFWESLAWVRWRERAATCFGWGVATALAIAVLGALLRTPDIDMPMKRLLSDRFSILLVGLAAVTWGPVCEELAFRGFLMPLLARSLGAPAGIVLSAAPFALLHGPQYGWSWRHVLLIVIAGTAFGWMRRRTGSTAAAAWMHASYNLTFFAVYILNGKDLPAQW